PELSAVIEDNQPIPPYSVLLGICEDGLPLLLNLNSARAGGVLLLGDQGISNTYTLHQILYGATQIYTAQEIQIHLVSPHELTLVGLASIPQIKTCFDPAHNYCDLLIDELVNLVDSRQGQIHTPPIHILAIDGLDILYKSIPVESQHQLEWLAKNGPEQGVFIFATLETNIVSAVPDELINTFGSRMLGNIDNMEMGNFLSGGAGSELQTLNLDREALVQSGNNLIRVTIPEIKFNTYS
ncbi:MAG: hypothetical protein N2D54_05375, partial [Chloroflexota bacterium]